VLRFVDGKTTGPSGTFARGIPLQLRRREGRSTDRNVHRQADSVHREVFLTLIFTALRPKEARWIRREHVILEGSSSACGMGSARKREYRECQWFFHIAGQRFDADALETAGDRVRKARCCTAHGARTAICLKHTRNEG
jgi:hypothetical protein